MKKVPSIESTWLATVRARLAALMTMSESESQTCVCKSRLLSSPLYTCTSLLRNEEPAGCDFIAIFSRSFARGLLFATPTLAPWPCHVIIIGIVLAQLNPSHLESSFESQAPSESQCWNRRCPFSMTMIGFLQAISPRLQPFLSEVSRLFYHTVSWHRLERVDLSPAFIYSI